MSRPIAPIRLKGDFSLGSQVPGFLDWLYVSPSARSNKIIAQSDIVPHFLLSAVYRSLPVSHCAARQIKTFINDGPVAVVQFDLCPPTSLSGGRSVLGFVNASSKFGLVIKLFE